MIVVRSWSYNMNFVFFDQDLKCSEPSIKICLWKDNRKIESVDIKKFLNKLE